MICSIICPKTKRDFEKYYFTRWKILRKPFGMPYGSEKDNLENNSFHIMAMNNHNVI